MVVHWKHTLESRFESLVGIRDPGVSQPVDSNFSESLREKLENHVHYCLFSIGTRVKARSMMLLLVSR